MTIRATRQAFLALCGVSKRHSPWLDPEHVGEQMAADGVAVMVYAFSGAVLGDGDVIDPTTWRVPLVDGGTAHGRLLVRRSRLIELEQKELVN
jgi:hypothetical protein